MTKEPLVEHDQRKAPASWDAAEYFGEKRLSRWTREPFQQVSSRSFPIWTSIGHTLLPSFVSSYLRPNSAARTKRLHDTAYLDGLRGIGAFVVYLHHTHMMYSMDGLYGYGSKAGANHILQLPFIRLVTAGPGAVALFFLISGYVLSLKTLTHIHENQPEKVLSSLASSVLRRGLRLYLPFAVISLFLAINSQTNFPVAIPHLDYHQPSFQAQITHWWKMIAMTTNPLHKIEKPYEPTVYLAPAWTLCIEYTGSMYVYIFLLALSQAKRWIHVLVVSVVGVYWQFAIGDSHSPYIGMFSVGMLLAELAIVFPPPTSSRGHENAYFNNRRNSGSFRRIHQLVAMILFIIALFLLSASRFGMKDTPGYVTIANFIPVEYDEDPAKLLVCIGSTLLVLVIMYSPTRTCTQNGAQAQGTGLLEQKHYDAANAPFFQRLFTNRISQYLGRISFSLYLWHEPLKNVVGSAYAQATRELTQNYLAAAANITTGEELKQLQVQYDRDYLSYSIPGLVWTTIVVIWVSDVFCRLVDEPSTRFARRLSQWTQK